MTTAAGITFKHKNGAFGKKYLPETMGSGVRVPRRRRRRLAGHLPRQLDELAGPAGRAVVPGALPQQPRRHVHRRHARGRARRRRCTASGVAAADYDNDGTSTSTSPALGGNHLFRNLGGGKFADVTAQAGVGEQRLLDQRGLVRLRQGRPARSVRRATTCEWSVDKDLFCTLDGKTKSYCTPESYKGQSPTLYHNRGDGTFEDVTREGRAVRSDVEGARRGAARLRRRRLARPLRRQRHAAEPALPQQAATAPSRTSAMTAGVAFNEAGVARAGMGVDAADYDGSGPARASIIGNFSNEMMALYHNEGNGLFIDEAPTSTDRARRRC